MFSADPRARARRSLEGLSIGDAFGERFFVNPAVVQSLIADRALPEPPWRYTDDTEMALGIFEVLERHGAVDQDDLARTFARRYVADPRRGYGGTAHEILADIARGEPWRAVSAAPYGGTGSMGNGAAMRVAPLGAFFADDVERAAAEAKKSAAVTHHHPEGQAGAIAIAVAAATVSRAPELPADAFFAAVVEHVFPSKTRDGIDRARELAADTPLDDVVRALGNGSRVIAEDTVPFTLWCAAHERSDYEAAMWKTVAALGDRDTTCAIVGGIVALSASPSTIPDAWRAAREPLPMPLPIAGDTADVF